MLPRRGQRQSGSRALSFSRPVLLTRRGRCLATVDEEEAVAVRKSNYSGDSRGFLKRLSRAIPNPYQRAFGGSRR
jgi:hypothetical protein